MLLKIAWRNIWRNKRRSIIVLLSVVVGVIAILLNDALSIGMISQILDNQVGSYVSYIQIHEKGFNDNKVIQKLVPEPARVETLLQRDPAIQSYSKRIISYGLLSSAASSSGINLVGVDPSLEQNVTTVKSSIVAGMYLTGKKREIIIGRKLAEKLGIGLGDKVVAMASTLHGNVGADVFRVVGLFETVSSEFDKVFAFASLQNMQEMLEVGDSISEFAIITKDRNKIEEVKLRLSQSLGESYEVLSYADLMPLMIAQVQIYKQSIYIVYLIVGLAMIFGIINTMLMSVFERIQEFGVLMAIGMKNSLLFRMILIEAATIGIIGALAGLVAGLAILVPLTSTGINLSMFSESLSGFGVGSIIYPVISIETLIESVIIIPFVAIIGALYPAAKATHLAPVNAIRYV